MPFDRRVVITGVGVVSPLGNSAPQVWESLRAGRSGIRELQSIAPDYLPTPYGAEAWDFTGHISEFGELDGARKKAIRKGLKVMCREIQMGVAAAQLAMSDASLNPGEYDVDRTGVVYGSDYIMTTPHEFVDGVRKCTTDGTFGFERWADDGLPNVQPLWLLKFLPNMPASHIAIYNDLRGPNNSLTLREASGNLALAEACCTISRGSADAIIAGATGTRVHPLRTIHVYLQEALASYGDGPEQMSRPFDRNRSGLVIGEGAGAVILEELESAQKRGATILGEVVGYGSSTVFDKDVAGQTEAAIRNVLRQAFSTSGLTSAEIGHVHAHGLSSQELDKGEARGINAAFQDRDSAVPVVAAKSAFGNLGAGSGVVELIASLSAINNGELFPLQNYDDPDPDCPIHAASGGEPAGDSFVNLSISPQGQASAIVIKTAA